MKRFLVILPCLYLAAVLAAGCLSGGVRPARAAAGGQVAPPHFLALPGVGAFSDAQVGRWDATAKRFVGGPLTASTSPIASTDLLSGLAIDYYAGILYSPASYAGPASRITPFYSRFDAPGDANARGGTFELRGSGNNPALDAFTGGSYYTGSGTVGNLRAGAALSINQNSGTSTLSEGLLGLSSNTGSGTTIESDALRGRVINSAGATTTARAVYAQAILTGGSAAAVYGLDISNWQSGATVPVSAAINIDATVDQGAARHCIQSASTSPSDFAGDVAVTDSARGLILKSPGGHYWRLTVSDLGAISAADQGTSTP